MKTDMPKRFNPQDREKDIYAAWEETRAFHAEPDNNGEPYCIVIPPPNVTGALHLGHAINNTLQDILIRYHRMLGHNTLWMPGVDHAGIATQAVVEKKLFEQTGKTRHDIGREELIKRIWEWKDQYGSRIVSQLKLMGCSCDWDRERFTLDDVCAKAVRHTFFKMFRDGLIYKGKRMVNWDTHLQTSVSDDEVYHETVSGHLWYYRYPVTGANEKLLIATTRPETMLGDTAVAVHPDDDRYKHLIGKTADLPLTNRKIPIIADAELVDPEFGTGCVKVTPAHDPNDYQCGLRNNLEMLNILNPDGTINENGGDFCGMNVMEARRAVVKALEKSGLFEKTEDYQTEIGHSDRSKTPVQPYLADQWFLRMADFAQTAIDALEDGKFKIYPQRYGKMYVDWLSEKRDWPIGRQLWWGHRIPIWHGPDCTEEDLKKAFSGRDDISWLYDDEHEEWLICSMTDDLAEDAVPGHTITQDDDVLDTWFSSALWPHSTLGWPEQTAELKKWYPTNVLITSRDIITLWVARMVISGCYNMKDIPFYDVYIHVKILDGQGQSMSKSKGNGVDPVDIIEQYGADALRFSLASMATETQDMRIPVDYKCPHCGERTPQKPDNMQVHTLNCSKCGKEMATRWADESVQERTGLALLTSEKFEIGRNFTNKLWNAARLVMMNLQGDEQALTSDMLTEKEDRWIVDSINLCVRQTDELLTQESSGVKYRFSQAIQNIYRVFWNDLCDSYLEIGKPRFKQGDLAARSVARYALEVLLKLMHPFIPFVTEEIWSSFRTETESMLIVSEWPKYKPELVFEEERDGMDLALECVKAARKLKSESGIPVRKKINCLGICGCGIERIEPYMDVIRTLAVCETVETAELENAKSELLDSGISVQLPVESVDTDKERKRLEKELEEKESLLQKSQAKLNNKNFVDRAPDAVVNREREFVSEHTAAIEKLKESIANLG